MVKKKYKEEPVLNVKSTKASARNLAKRYVKGMKKEGYPHAKAKVKKAKDTYILTPVKKKGYAVVIHQGRRVKKKRKRKK